MKKILMMLAVVSTVGLAGCGQVSQDELDELKNQQSAQAAKIKAKDGEIEALQARLKALEKAEQPALVTSKDYGPELSALTDRLDVLETAEPQVDANSLAIEIKSLKARIKSLESLGTVAEEEPTVEAVAEETKTEVKKFTEVDQARVDALIPMMNTSGATVEQRNELQSLLNKADKETRAKAVAALKEMVKAEPENQYVRLALAETMTTQFQDLEFGPKMGQLASDIKKEADKAIEIDPDYYDARHYLALFNVNHPAFTPEFKGANIQLDEALKLQESLTWEDRFAEIYAGYGVWYQKQKMYDEGLAKVQEGLDKAPRNEDLIETKAILEKAKADEGDE